MSTPEIEAKIKDILTAIEKINLHIQLLDEKCKVKDVKFNTELLVSEKLNEIMKGINDIKLELFLDKHEEEEQKKPPKKTRVTRKKKIDSDSD